MVDVNPYKIVSMRYDQYFNEEEIFIHQGWYHENMKTLFDSVKGRQGPNLIRLELRDREGNVLESYP